MYICFALGVEYSCEELPAATYAYMQSFSHSLSTPVADKFICIFTFKLR